VSSMTPSNSKTFTDAGDHLLDFMQDYSVECPHCAHRASVCVIDQTAPALFAPRRLTCAGCGYTAEWRERSVCSRFSEEPRDWYFKRPFWYRTNCCGHVLWVLNRDHLEFLRHYVGAQIRSRARGQTGWSNRSLASRLPKWISSASHRTDILLALERLEVAMNTDKPDAESPAMSLQLTLESQWRRVSDLER
jgi:hypothetical protein